MLDSYSETNDGSMLANGQFLFVFYLLMSNVCFPVRLLTKSYI